MKNNDKKIDKIKSYKMETWLISSLFIAIMIIIIFVITKFFYFRFDLTKGNKFSISKPTVELVKKINNKLIIKYYYNDNCREHVGMSKVVQYINDLLKEYKNYSKGYVEIISEELSTQRDREKLDELESKGLSYKSLSEASAGEARLSQGMSGIIINYEGKESVIPQIFTDVGFEYLIDKEIKKIINDNNANIGLILAYGNKSFENEYSYLKQILESEYSKTTIINSGENIPTDINVIMVIGAEQLTDYDVFKIDQFLMNGGKAFFTTSGINILYNQYSQIALPKDGKLFDLLNHYGITINKNLIGDNESYRAVPRSILEESRYPIWPIITGENINKTNPIVKNFKNLGFFWVSSIDIDEKIKNNTEILLKTTNKAWEKKDRMELGLDNYKYPIEQGDKQFNIACAFKGSLESYYKGKEIPKNENENIKYELGRKDSGNTQLVVISNDMFFENSILDSRLVTQSEINLLINSFDWLTEDLSLIQIRDKKKFLNELDKVKPNTKQFDTRKNIVIAVSTYIMPFLIIAAAILINLLRYSRRKKILEEYKK
ncbi:MAG: GldG family protein [Spirochaetes bacterium]|nr:GldG family protein [Spirochaetota bacterium]